MFKPEYYIVNHRINDKMHYNLRCKLDTRTDIHIAFLEQITEGYGEKIVDALNNFPIHKK